ncbi:MAG: xanthine dehydrogenase accessory protein XdhC [Pseudomonadota bacterium]
MRPVTVEIVATRGSAPRDAGTAMVVEAETIRGTIGGGALEHRAIALARVGRALPFEDTIALGPGLGQCCGGVVTLRFSEGVKCLAPPQVLLKPTVPDHWQSRPLWVWGAGHVGRALVEQAVPLGAFDITWIDTAADRFPALVPQTVNVLPAADLPTAMAYAPGDAAHLIFTYSHDFDLALCDAALRRGFAFCGLIGSDTKWARFRKRLSGMGHADADIARITCPIGDKSMGKHPDFIALGTLRQLLSSEHWPGGMT